MKITSVEKHGRNKKRFSIYIDGTYSFSVSEEDYFRLNLYEDKEISSEEIDIIKNDINLRHAKTSALKYISFKLRSEAEVREKLLKEGFDRETVEKSINELKALGYVNDIIYAQKYIFDRSKLKPKSKKMLAYELKNKGIDQAVIDNVLMNFVLDDEVIAYRLIKKRFGKYDLDGKTVKRIYSFLSYRGFDMDTIKKAVDSLKEGKAY